jgi:hypothetical protein
MTLNSLWTQLPIGTIQPQGWLHDQLVAQASGLTGRLEEFWPDVGPDSPDLRVHQYHQQVNQIACSIAHRDWTYSSDDANIISVIAPVLTKYLCW